MNNIIDIYALLIVISALSLLGIVVVVAKAIIIGVSVKKYNTVSEYKAKVRFYSIGKGVKRANSMSHEEILAKLMYMIKRNSKGRGYYDYYLLLIYFPSVLFFSWKYPVYYYMKQLDMPNLVFYVPFQELISVLLTTITLFLGVAIKAASYEANLLYKQYLQLSSLDQEHSNESTMKK